MSQAMLFFGRQRAATEIPQQAEAAAADPDYEARLQEAYDRGRRYERAMHRITPLAQTLTGAAAVIGLGISMLAAHERSFARAGQIMDADLAKAHVQAAPMAREASVLFGRLADASGQLLQRQEQAAERPGSSTPDQAGPAQRP